MAENLSNVSPARINDLVYKLDGKYSNEAARKLVVIGKNPKTKQQLITILQEKRKEFESKSKPCVSNILGNIIVEGNSRRESHYSALADKTDRAIKEIQKTSQNDNSIRFPSSYGF